jgi:hypothetical protein
MYRVLKTWKQNNCFILNCFPILGAKLSLAAATWCVKLQDGFAENLPI